MDFNSDRDGMTVIVLLLIAVVRIEEDDDADDDDDPKLVSLIPFKVFRSVCSAF
jgi:hypothetical protein